MKRDLVLDPPVSWLVRSFVRPATNVIAAWRGITWKHLYWTLVISVVYRVSIQLSTAQMYDHWIGGPAGYVVFGFDWNELAVPFFYLLTVRVAEHGDCGQPKAWLRYVAAVVVATAACFLMFNSILSAEPLTDRIEWLAWETTNVLVFSGLIVSAYVRLLHARRMQAAFADAEVERARASRQVLASRLAAMQARVEPRFLFSTLAQVEALYERDAPGADRVLDDLIAYLRAALPQLRGEGSSLGKEAQLAEAYLRIVQARMGSRLDFAFDIPADLADTGFPPMLLLPIIDNALRHGLEPLPLGGRIDVRARVEGNRLALTISDNGLGNASALREGPGLATIRERLHGLFGDDVELALTATEPHGITATIEVPYEPTRDHR